MRTSYLASPARARSRTPQLMPVDVAAGETVENVDFKLIRAGAVNGRVVDDYGDAVVNGRVTARRWIFTGGGRRLQVVAATDTDDLGEFRLSDLTAGSYHIAAVYPSSAADAIGTVSSVRYTANYPLPLSQAKGLRVGLPDLPVFWAFYPGVPTAAHAQRVEIREGRDITGIDFAVAALRGASVSGTVLDPWGRPAIDAMVTLTSAGAEPFTVGVMTTPARSPDGSFHFPWVWPGEYVLTAHLRVGRSAGVALAAQSLTVAGEDVKNINVAMIGGGDPILGRIRTDGKPPDFSPDRLRVRLVSAENEDLIARFPLPLSGFVAPDWTFELARIPGLRLVRADTGRPLREVTVQVIATAIGVVRSTWTDALGCYSLTNLQAARYVVQASKLAYATLQFGENPLLGSTGTPVQVSEGKTVPNVDFWLPKRGVITGRVVDDAGEPVPNVLVQAMDVVPVSGDEQPRAFPHAPSARTTNDLGRYRLFGIPTGDYVVLALPGTQAAKIPAELSGFIRTYFPGSTGLAAATVLSVKAGQEVQNVDIVLAAAPPSRK